MKRFLRRIVISFLILFINVSIFSTLCQSPLLAQQLPRQNNDNTTNIQARNGLLNMHLQSMAGEAERDRLLGSYVMFGLGGLSVIGGAATLLYGDNNDQSLGWGLVGSGIVVGGLGFIPRNVISEPERIYDEYSDMPDDTNDEMTAKYFYGDNRFQSLAERSRRQRIVSGISSIASALVSYGLEPDAEEFPALLLINAASQLFLPRDIETRYRSYEEAKRDLSAIAESPQTSLRLFALPGGAGLTFQVRF